MRVQKTPTGWTLFITKKLWVHWFYRSQRLWYVWGFHSEALHLPWCMLGVKR